MAIYSVTSLLRTQGACTPKASVEVAHMARCKWETVLSVRLEHSNKVRCVTSARLFRCVGCEGKNQAFWLRWGRNREIWIFWYPWWGWEDNRTHRWLFQDEVRKWRTERSVLNRYVADLLLLYHSWRIWETGSERETLWILFYEGSF